MENVIKDTIKSYLNEVVDDKYSNVIVDVKDNKLILEMNGNKIEIKIPCNGNIINLSLDENDCFTLVFDSKVISNGNMTNKFMIDMRKLITREEKVDLIKSIAFQIKLNGFGIVNFDSVQQKSILNKLFGDSTSNDNGKFSKKTFFKCGLDENGVNKYGYKLKISSQCLRHAIWQNDLSVNSPLALKYYPLLEKMMLTNTGISHGYMFTMGDKSFKKKSALTISDAEQTNDTIISNEIGVASGVRSDNSMYFHDSIGETEYVSRGFINFSELEFISGDILFDRQSYESDKNANDTFIDVYEKETYGEGNREHKDFKEGYYTDMFQTYGETFPEKGIYVSDNKIIEIVKDLLYRLLNISIQRANGEAHTTELKIKLIRNLGDTLDENWIVIKNEDDINNINFVPFRKYKEVDEAKAIKYHIEVEKTYNEIKKKIKEKKDDKKASKKSNKKSSKNSNDGVVNSNDNDMNSEVSDVNSNDSE